MSIEEGEGKYLQFKEEEVYPGSLAKTMVAFSNSEGGTILIDVNNTGKIKGVTQKGLEEWLVNVSQNNCIPSVEPSIEKIT